MKCQTPERTGWRDQWISGLHRTFGLRCLATDLDFVLLEHGYGEPCALVEMKYCMAVIPDKNNINMRALISLADGHHVYDQRQNKWIHKPIAAMIVVYSYEPWFSIRVLNETAAKIFGYDESSISVMEYVERLYTLRGIYLSDAEKRQIENNIEKFIKENKEKAGW